MINDRIISHFRLERIGSDRERKMCVNLISRSTVHVYDSRHGGPRNARFKLYRLGHRFARKGFGRFRRFDNKVSDLAVAGSTRRQIYTKMLEFDKNEC